MSDHRLGIVVEGGGDQAVELGVSKDIPPGTQIFVRTVGGPVRLPRGGEVIGRRPEIRAYHAGAKETGGQKGEMSSFLQTLLRR